MSSTTELAAAIPYLKEAESEFWESLRNSKASTHWRDNRREALTQIRDSITSTDEGRTYDMVLFEEPVTIVRRYRLLHVNDREHGESHVPVAELSFYFGEEEDADQSILIGADRMLGANAVELAKQNECRDPIRVAREFNDVVEHIVRERFILR